MKFKVGDRIFANNLMNLVGTILKIEDNRYYCKDWYGIYTGIQHEGLFATSTPILAAPILNERKLKEKLGLNVGKDSSDE